MAQRPPLDPEQFRPNARRNARSLVLILVGLGGFLALVLWVADRLDRVEGITAMRESISRGDLREVQRLEAEGVDWRWLGNTRMAEFSALHEAAGRGHLDIVKYFVEHGADVNAVGYGQFTPLTWALERGHLPVAEYLLLEAGGGDSITADDPAVYWMANHAGYQIWSWVLDKGIEPYVKIPQGHSLLLAAAYKDNFAMADFLLRNNVPANPSVDRWGFGYFVDTGADTVPIPSNGIPESFTDNRTPLHWAVIRENAAMVQLLVKHNADRTIQDAEGLTALDHAQQLGFTEIIELFDESAEP